MAVSTFCYALLFEAISSGVRVASCDLGRSELQGRDTRAAGSSACRMHIDISIDTRFRGSTIAFAGVREDGFLFAIRPRREEGHNADEESDESSQDDQAPGKDARDEDGNDGAGEGRKAPIECSPFGDQEVFAQAAREVEGGHAREPHRRREPEEEHLVARELHRPRVVEARSRAPVEAKGWGANDAPIRRWKFVVADLEPEARRAQDHPPRLRKSRVIEAHGTFEVETCIVHVLETCTKRRGRERGRPSPRHGL